MSYQILSLDAVAEYLHLTPADIAERVKCNEIPHEKRGRRIVFSKDEIDLWASQRLLSMPGQRLTEYHRESTRGTREILPDLIQPGFIAPALAGGDGEARRILEETAGDLGFGLSHVVQLLHPQVIVLGGGLSLLGEPLRAVFSGDDLI